ncbi:MAG: RIP metalloprotease RseP [Gallionella sp.]|nr:RIP metalloprotease RseP [Gallionella sp.]MDD4958114.1 RIP metalloprotease RseP [Gallionella sp.]
MLTIAAFVGAIAILVFVHEFGHFWIARRCGVKVLRFSIGFGKVLYTRVIGETEWALSLIPLGGYVRMLDEREDPVPAEQLQYAFNRKPVWQRMAIVAAGPMANFLLAIVLYWVVMMHGVPGLKPTLGDIPAGTPAALAQMQAGETLVRINDEPVPSWQEVRWTLLELALQQADVRIEALSRNGMLQNHILSLGGLEAKDLDGEFLDKLGLHLYQPKISPVIGQFAPDSVAHAAGLQLGDKIVRINEIAIKDWRDLVAVVSNHADQSVQIEVLRGDSTLKLTLIPKAEVQNGKTIGKLGVGPKIDQTEWDALFVEVSYPPVEAAWQALRKTWETSSVSLKIFGKMLLGEVSVKNISGPVTIADYAGQSAHMGWVSYLGFLALISISLGVLNLLPIPLLDGGHLLYYAVEWIKGSAVSERLWELGQKVGIALIGTLMIFALYNDLNRLISG